MSRSLTIGCSRSLEAEALRIQGGGCISTTPVVRFHYIQNLRLEHDRPRLVRRASGGHVVQSMWPREMDEVLGTHREATVAPAKKGATVMDRLSNDYPRDCAITTPLSLYMFQR